MSQASVIGAGTTVRGSVEGDGSLEILGHVEGDVTMVGDIAIAEGASVLGNVTGARVTVRGAVKGDLNGTDAVLLERGARVVGDLSAPRIGVGAGALVRGNVRTEGEPAVGGAKRPAVSAFKPAAFVAKPVAKAEPKVPPPAPLLPRVEVEEAADDEEDEDLEETPPPPVRAREAERRPPPPVLPSLGKGTKAKKKRGRDE